MSTPPLCRAQVAESTVALVPRATEGEREASPLVTDVGEGRPLGPRAAGVELKASLPAAAPSGAVGLTPRASCISSGGDARPCSGLSRAAVRAVCTGIGPWLFLLTSSANQKCKKLRSSGSENDAKYARPPV